MPDHRGADDSPGTARAPGQMTAAVFAPPREVALQRLAIGCLTPRRIGWSSREKADRNSSSMAIGAGLSSPARGRVLETEPSSEKGNESPIVIGQV